MKKVIKIILIVIIVLLSCIVFYLYNEENNDNKNKTKTEVKEEVNTTNNKTDSDDSTSSQTNSTSNETETSSNKEIKKEVKPKVVDVDRIELIGDEEITLNKGDKYKELGAKAYNKNGKDISDNIEISSNVDTSTPGSYKVSYSIGNYIVFREVIVK